MRKRYPAGAILLLALIFAAGFGSGYRTASRDGELVRQAAREAIAKQSIVISWGDKKTTVRDMTPLADDEVPGLLSVDPLPGVKR